MGQEDYYKSKADSNRNKRDRLKEAVSKADGYITTARQYRKKMPREAKPSTWKGASCKKFSSKMMSLDGKAALFVTQMDHVRDGYNKEQAAANTSYLSFLSRWKAAIQNEFN